jgi:hypothetical protein
MKTHSRDVFDISLVLLQSGAAETVLALLREFLSRFLLFLPRFLINNPLDMLRLIL